MFNPKTVLNQFYHIVHIYMLVQIDYGNLHIPTMSNLYTSSYCETTS